MQTIRHGNLISFAERESQRIDDRSYLIEEIDFTMNDGFIVPGNESAKFLNAHLRLKLNK